MVDNNRLGRGLGAIFGDDVSNVLEDIQQGATEQYGAIKTSVKVKDIRTNPFQPRRHFDQAKIDELAESIATHGLFTPVLVREASKGYELVAGERRLRASRQIGIEEIPAIVVSFDDEQMMEIAIIENVQREDLNVIEEALAYQALIERLNLTQEDVAKRVSKSRSHITNLLRLLKLPRKVQEMVSENKLTMGHVRPLITLDDDTKALEFAQEILDKKMSVREAEALVQRSSRKTSKEKPQKNNDFDYVKQVMEQKLMTRVSVEKGKLSIHFTDNDDLNRILELLGVIE